MDPAPLLPRADRLAGALGGHLTDAGALTALCEEAAHLTAAIAGESDESSGTGNAAGNAAKDPKADDPWIGGGTPRRRGDPPASIGAAEAAFRHHLATAPRSWGRTLRLAVAIIAFFIFRKNLRDASRRYAAEAFFRAYAKSRGMRLEEPLHFAATHADAKLPFRPDRVPVGPLPGGGEAPSASWATDPSAPTGSPSSPGPPGRSPNRSSRPNRRA